MTNSSSFPHAQRWMIPTKKKLAVIMWVQLNFQYWTKNLAGAWYNSSLNALIDKLKLDTEKWTDWKKNRSVLLISRQTTVLLYSTNINFPNVWSMPIFFIRIVLLCLDITIDARIVQHDALELFIKIKMISLKWLGLSLWKHFLHYLKHLNAIFCKIILCEVWIFSEKLMHYYQSLPEYLYGQCVSIEDFIKERKLSATTRLT